MSEATAAPVTRQFALRITLPLLIAAVTQLSLSVWAVAGYHFQIQDQAKRITELEANDKAQTITAHEISSRLSRIEGQLSAALSQPQPTRKN